jgi:hypothetical protein
MLCVTHSLGSGSTTRTLEANEGGRVTRFKFGRLVEFNIAKPTALEIAALALVLAFVLILAWWR